MKDKGRREPFREILKSAGAKGDKSVQQPADPSPQLPPPPQPSPKPKPPSPPKTPPQEKAHYAPHPAEEVPQQKKSRKLFFSILSVFILTAACMIAGAIIFHSSYTNKAARKRQEVKAQTEGEQLATLQTQVELLKTKLSVLEQKRSPEVGKDEKEDKKEERGAGENAETLSPPTTPPSPPPAMPLLPDISPIHGNSGIIQASMKGCYFQERDQVTCVGSAQNTDTSMSHGVFLMDSKAIVDFGGSSQEVELYTFGGFLRFLGGSDRAQLIAGMPVTFTFSFRVLGGQPKKFGLILTLKTTADSVNHQYDFKDIPMATSKQQLL